MEYPNEKDIVDPLPTLPPEVSAELKPYVEHAQRRYRSFRQRFREDTSIWREEPAIIADHGADILKKLVALALRGSAADFAGFRRAIGWEGGCAAKIAWQCAHYLYKDVQSGRMPREWQWKNLEPRLSELLRDAEDIWYDRELVPKGWEGFLGQPEPGTDKRPATAAPSPPEDPEALRQRLAKARKAFVEPILRQKGWSLLDFSGKAIVDYKTITHFLEGGKSYNDTRLKIANALGISVDQLPE
jgi:lambda repressor-like predicted transcriptional regulator